MADKYVALADGRLITRAGTAASAGSADAGKIVALESDGRLSPSVLPAGIGADTVSRVASETLAAGDLVNIWNDAGTPKMRKADAAAPGKECSAFVKDAVSAGQTGLAYSEGSITGLTGLTPGARCYLGTTPGQITMTPPVATGNVVQFVGTAHGADILSFEPGDGVVLG